ncbi:Transcription factor E2F7 [Hordeum vulgare]|nr:Transcription factor E2F7 [Hordeum vulgare]
MAAPPSSAPAAVETTTTAPVPRLPNTLPLPVFGEGGGVRLRHHAYSRKQKSLGLLCSNFVALYDRDGVESIGLDDASSRLGVERRRIYDIVNVLESVGILARKAKNRYSWIGFGGVPMALRELKERALREKSGLAPLPVEEISSANMSDDEDDGKLGDPEAETEGEKPSQTVDNPSDMPDAPPCQLRSDHRKEKSLGLLTQNFVKLFLTMEVSTISLDEAAKFLLGEGHEESNMRTKVRRLYDIANVLSSLKLIEKTQVDTRKPAFRWLGMAGKPKAENGVTIVASPARKSILSNKRVFGTELTNIGINRSKLESTIQKKPKLAQGGADILKSYNVAAQKQPGQVNKSGFVYGPFHPSCARKQEPDECNNIGQRATPHDWESLADSFRPQYQNPDVNF